MLKILWNVLFKSVCLSLLYVYFISLRSHALLEFHVHSKYRSTVL